MGKGRGAAVGEPSGDTLANRCASGARPQLLDPYFVKVESNFKRCLFFCLFKIEHFRTLYDLGSIPVALALPRVVLAVPLPASNAFGNLIITARAPACRARELNVE